MRRVQCVERYFAHSVEDTWDVLFDPEFWPVYEESGEAQTTVGARFVIGPIPTLGGRYTGELDCEVTEVIPGKLVAYNVIPRVSKGSPAQWTNRTELKATGGGTNVTITVSGPDMADPDDRRFWYVLAMSAERLFDEVAAELQRRATTDG